jgi:hypothetical protein
MRNRQWLLLAVLCCSSAFAQSQTAFKAQNGWGLPRLLATPSVTQGVVIDPGGKQVIVAEAAGLEARDLSGQNKKMLFEQSGIRGLLGQGTGSELSLAWYRRDRLGSDGVWWWYRGRAVLAFETPYAQFGLLKFQEKPVLVGVLQKAEKSVLVMQIWGQPAKTIFQTSLNIGALGVNVLGDKIGVVFAEGFRSGQDEKYDLRFLQIASLELDVPKVQSQILAPAVYTGTDQRFGVAIKAKQFLPIWWYETLEEQRAAAFTGQHNPRLALYDNGKIIEFAPAGPYLGQIDNALYFSLKNQIFSYNLENRGARVEITTPEHFATASLSSQRFIAWQSLQRDGYSSQLWLTDSNAPFEPTLVDQVSKTLGWNPWFPLQNLFGQSALSFMLAALAVIITAPIVWLLRGRFLFGQSIWFGIGFASVVLLLVRFLGGSASTADWIFAPLLAASWWVVLLGLGFGSGLVYLGRQKLNAAELGATITASLVVFISTFVTVFSRIGFLQF